MSLSEPFYGYDPDPPAGNLGLSEVPDDLAEASKGWLAKALTAERSRTEDLETKLDEVYAREKILIEGLQDEQERRKALEAAGTVDPKRAAISWLAEQYRDESVSESRRWQFGLVLVHALDLENDGEIGKALEAYFRRGES